MLACFEKQPEDGEFTIMRPGGVRRFAIPLGISRITGSKLERPDSVTSVPLLVTENSSIADAQQRYSSSYR
jgi:hypothetical protein